MSKKITTLTVVVILLFGISNAFATASRMEALGNQGLYLTDDTNPYSNPSCQSYYPDRLSIHMGGIYGGDVSAIAGISLGLTDKMVLGLVVGGPGALVMIVEGGINTIKTNAILHNPYTLRPKAFNEYFEDLLPLGSTPPSPNRVDTGWMNPIGAILAYKSGNTAVGLGYVFVNGKYEENDEISDTDLDEKAVMHAMQIGVSTKMGKTMLEAWIHWYPYSVKSKYTDSVMESAEDLTGNRLNLAGRLIYSFSDTVTIVPAFSWERVTGDVNFDTTPDTDLGLAAPYDDLTEEALDQTYLLDEVITGLNIQYHTGGFFGLLITGTVALEWNRWYRELEINETDFNSKHNEKEFLAPRAALGIEYWANKTFCFRAGVSTSTLWAATVVEDDNVDVDGTITEAIETMETVQVTTAAVGLGLHFGKLLIDGTFGNMFLAGEDGDLMGDGPNLFSNLDLKVRW